jgi:hypothetical protein
MKNEKKKIVTAIVAILLAGYIGVSIYGRVSDANSDKAAEAAVEKLDLSKQYEKAMERALAEQQAKPRALK